MRKPAPLRLDDTYNGDEGGRKGMEWPPGQTSRNPTRMAGEEVRGGNSQRSFTQFSPFKARRRSLIASRLFTVRLSFGKRTSNYA